MGAKLHTFDRLKNARGFTDYIIVGIETSREKSHCTIGSVVENIDRYCIIHLRSINGRLSKVCDITEVEGCDIFATLLQYYDIGRNTLIICNNSLVFLGSSDLVSLLENDIYKVSRSEMYATDIMDEENEVVSQYQFIASAPPTVVGLYSYRNKSKLTIVDIANYGIKNVVAFFGQFNIDYTAEYKSYSGAILSLDKCDGYCIAMYFIFKKLHELVRLHKLGGFAVTYASQAMRAFRASHYNGGIVKHNNEIAATIEEGCYYGGRCEARYTGWYSGKCYLLDINSLYPSIGRSESFPTRLEENVVRPNREQISRLSSSNCCFGHVRIRDAEGKYPCKRDGRLTFPVGTYNTFLCGQEYTEAYRSGSIEVWYCLSTYRTGMILKSYSDEMLSIRSKYKNYGDKVAETLIKYITNGIWGKFAEIGSRWIIDNRAVASTEYGGFIHVDDRTFEKTHYRVIKGECSKLCRSYWNDNTFLPITAWMNAHCRMLLWRYMQFAGLSNVLYCAIDGFIVTEQGYDNLRPFISENPHAYGKFKVVQSDDRCYIHSQGKYRIGNKVALSGVPTDDMYKYRGFWNAKAESGTIDASNGIARVTISRMTKPSELRDSLGKYDEFTGQFTDLESHSDDVLTHLPQYSRRYMQSFLFDDYLQ